MLLRQKIVEFYNRIQEKMDQEAEELKRKVEEAKL